MKDGGPTFPMPTVHSPDWGTMEKGLTMRDWFAGQALAGLIANQPAPRHPEYWDWLSGVAVTPYRIADKMLTEREKEVTHE